MPSALLGLVASLLLPSLFAVAQSNRNISVGQTLTANEASAPWLSKSGDFAFGFKQLNIKGVFLLAIWYNKIPDKTIVWYPIGTNTVPRGSKVELTADRGLVLFDPQNVDLWSSPLTGDGVAYGVLYDTGNLLLADNSSQSLWESFNFPTDTLLPTQMLEIGGILSSRHGYDDFSSGRFQFRLLENGSAVLNPISLHSSYPYNAYYISGSFDSTDGLNSGYRVIFNQSGYLYVERKSGERISISELQDIGPASTYYHKATLNWDGVFTVSQHLKNPTANDSWSDIHIIPDNICVDQYDREGSGNCGFNNICSLKDNKRPICECPPRFSRIENDRYGSCKPDFPHSCEEDSKIPPEDLYEFVEVEHTDWPQNDFEVITPVNIDVSKNSCLHDCLCFVLGCSYAGCWKKREPLSNGRRDPTLPITHFLKVRKSNYTGKIPPSPQAANPKDHNTMIIVGSVLLGSSVFVNMLLVSALCLGFWFSYQRKLKGIQQDEGVAERNLRQFTCKQLVEATNGFDEELGRGACGIVYKGEVQNSPIAVKKLNKGLEASDKEFKTEVNIIGKTYHKNLVRLLGFCTEEQHRVLVYELLSNGSLASFLFGELKPSWNQRTNIAFGVARGLFYLHEECHTQIIHCDIKPHNILLDESYNARISDFGLAKILAMNQSRTDTNIRGTKGYVAPEWFQNSPITVKVDVYSFGVVLLEILCCRRNVDIEPGEERKIINWASNCYQEGKLDALVEDDPEAIENMKVVERFLMVAIWCLQENPLIRPNMKKVMLMLEGIVQVPVPPCPPPSSSIS